MTARTGAPMLRPSLAHATSLAIALTLILSAVATIPGSDASANTATTTRPVRGGSVTYGLEAETSGGWCLPRAQLAVSGIMVASAIYDTLTVPNAQNRIVPYLARSVTHDPQYTVWTIALRPDVVFHDDEPLTATAVAQNIDAWRASDALRLVYADIADVSVVDDLTVRVTTRRPWVDFDTFLYADGRAGIAAPAQLDDDATCPSNLIGTGPFMIYGGTGYWAPDQELVATRNPRYWQKDRYGARLPYLDRITFVPNPDATARFDQVQGGQLDITQTSSGEIMSQAAGRRIGQMRQKPGVRSVRYYLLNVHAPPFDDPVARQAVAYALDRRQVNAVRNAGEFTLADGPFDVKVPGYVKHPGFPAHDLARARRLAARYRAAHGGAFSVVIESGSDAEDSGEAQLVRHQLATAGIDATVREEDEASLLDTARAGRFGLLLWRNHPGDDPDANYVWWATGSPVNFGGIDDPQLQALLDQGRSEPDAARRAAVYQRVDRLFARKLYDLWGYYEDWDVLSGPKIHGLMGPPLPGGGGAAEYIGGRHPVVGIWRSR